MLGKLGSMSDIDTDEPLLNSEAVGKFLGLSVMTVRKMATNGELPGIAFGTSNRVVWRFSRGVLRKYIEDRTFVKGVTDVRDEIIVSKGLAKPN